METIISTELFDLIRFNDAPEREAVIYITSRDFDGGAQSIYTELDTSISFYELRVDNWDDNLTPWAADAKMKGRAFGGDGGKLLESIISDVIPVVGSQSAWLYHIVSCLSHLILFHFQRSPASSTALKSSLRLGIPYPKEILWLSEGHIDQV